MWSTGWRRTLWHAFLSFNRCSTLDLMHPQHHHATLTLKMAHLTSSSATGKRLSERGEGEGDGWTPGEMLRSLMKVLAGMLSVMQSVADPFEFPTQTCSNVAALLRTPNSSGGRSHLLDVFTPSSMLATGARGWDETYLGWWDDAMEPRKVAQSCRVRCGGDCMKKSR